MKLIYPLFLFISLAEVAAFILIGEWLGIALTILSVIATAAIGITLLRIQGLKTLHKAQQKTAQGEVPGQELIEGVLILLAGALLLTPGFLTDGFGFCLLSPIRSLIAAWILRKGMLQGVTWASSGTWQTGGSASNQNQASSIFEFDLSNSTRQTSSPQQGNQFQPGPTSANPNKQPNNNAKHQSNNPKTIEGQFERKD